MTSQAPNRRRDTRNRGRNFFVIDKGNLEKVATRRKGQSDRALLNMMIAFLVLACGTDGDQIKTPWSAHAIRKYSGMGLPRAQAAIQSLVEIGLIERAPDSSKNRPRYLLTKPSEVDPIFLPNALIMGLVKETPMLARLRPHGDPLALRLLIDLYGVVVIDAAYGLPLNMLKKESPFSSEKIFVAGAHAVWSVQLPSEEYQVSPATGVVFAPHRAAAPTPQDASSLFWKRVALLVDIGALVSEAWLFDGPGDDAEPMFPINANRELGTTGDAADLTLAAFAAAEALCLPSAPYWEQNLYGGLAIPLPGHFSEPSIKLVTQLRINASASGGLAAYAMRREKIEIWTSAFRQLHEQALAGDYSQPMHV
jgi:predicted transcriptional regulator